MGIIVNPYNQGFDYVVYTDNVPTDRSSYFQQLDGMDVSAYDLRALRNARHRQVNGVLHAWTTPFIEYRGVSIPFQGRKAISSKYYQWWSYPGMTIILTTSRVFKSRGYVGLAYEGTYCIPQLTVITCDETGRYPTTAKVEIYWELDTSYEEPGSETCICTAPTNSSGNPPLYRLMLDLEEEGYFSLMRTKAFVGINRREMVASVDDIVYSSLDPTNLYETIKSRVGLPGYTRKAWTAGATLQSIDPSFAFLLGENGFPDGYGDINYVLSEHYATLMKQHAYLDALTSVQHAWDNGIQNVTEFVKFFVNLFVHHKVEVPKSWKDGWLSYRYVYTTTKLDQEELATDVLNGLNKILADGQRYVLVRGQYDMDVAGTRVTCKCSVYLKNRVYDFLDKCKLQLERFGLKPDFYMAWDMTPYSFIVDWFLPIGDTLDVVDATQIYEGDNCIYEIGPIQYSYKYTRTVSGSTVHLYSRFVTRNLPIQAFYWFVEPDSTTLKTWGKRLLDGVSLFT